MSRIESSSNPTYKSLLKLKTKKYRRKTNSFIIEGKHMIAEAGSAGYTFKLISHNEELEPDILLSENLYNKLSHYDSPQPIMAIVDMKNNHKINGDRILILDNVQDPGNIGTLIRTAVGFKFKTVVLINADVYNDKIISSSQGALFKINIINWNDFKFEDVKDYQLVGTSLNEESCKLKHFSFKKKVALILGNEGKGVSKNILDKSENVYIDIDFESLNVAAAGAIIMYKIKN